MLLFQAYQRCAQRTIKLQHWFQLNLMSMGDSESELIFIKNSFRQVSPSKKRPRVLTVDKHYWYMLNHRNS